MNTTHNTRQKILIADDNFMNRAILEDMLADSFDILEAENGVEAVAKINQYGAAISLVLLDIVMPEMDGYEVLEIMNKNNLIADIPVIMISVENRSEYIEKAYNLGVVDFISRPFDTSIVKHRVFNTLMLYDKQKRLVDMVADQIYEKEKNSNMMINILSHIVEFRNGESGAHVLHIHRFTEVILEHLNNTDSGYSFSHNDIAIISMASALHDIGKMAIDESILNKPGKFTDEEFEIMKTHSAHGEAMLDKLDIYRDDPLVKVAKEICRWHHERYDGKGYPDRLKGDEIPIHAQVVSLADVYDALTSDRVYKQAYTHEKAMQMIIDGECGEFNPMLIKCLEEISDIIKCKVYIEKFVSDNDNKKIIGMIEEALSNNMLMSAESSFHRLEEERSKLRFLSEISENIQFEYTIDPPILNINKEWANVLGVKEVILDPIHSDLLKNIISKKALIELKQKFDAASPQDMTIQHYCKIKIGNNKRWHRIVCNVKWSEGENAGPVSVDGVVTDVHNEYEMFADMQKKASHDYITGLWNGLYFRKKVESRINKGTGKFAFINIDIDDFKQINDKYGHSFGDKTLQYIAKRIHDIAGIHAICSRVSGDEFVVFWEYDSDDSIMHMVQDLFDAVNTQYRSVKVSSSMGVVLCNDRNIDYEMLFDKADKALYTSKREGKKQISVYNDSMKDMFTYN